MLMARHDDNNDDDDDDENIAKSPVDLWGLSVSQTPVKDLQLKLL